LGIPEELHHYKGNIIFGIGRYAYKKKTVISAGLVANKDAINQCYKLQTGSKQFRQF